MELRLGGRAWRGWRRWGRQWVVALSSVAVVACGPALTAGVSPSYARDRLASWTASWMPFLPPAHPASDPRTKALVETLTSELAARTAEAAGGTEGDLALTIGPDGAWTLESLPPELGWERRTELLIGNLAPIRPAPLLPIGPSLLPAPAPAPAARPTAPALVNGKVPQVVIRPGGPPAITLDEIVANAKQYLGVPYVWGGNSASGLDCSAYVSKSWGVGRYTTDSIGAVSFKIMKDDLLPGDILNLTTREDPRGYGHVRLFAGWANAERTRMWVYEETPPKALFHAIAYDSSYTPMRRVNYVPDGSAAEALEAALKAGATAAPKGSTGPGPGPVGATAREQRAPNPVAKVVEEASKALKDAAKATGGGLPFLPGPQQNGNGRGRQQPAQPTPPKPTQTSKPTPTARPLAPTAGSGALSASTASTTSASTAANTAVPTATGQPTQAPPTRTAQPTRTATRVPPTPTRVPPTATRQAQTSRFQVVSVPTAVPTSPPAPVVEPTVRPTRTARPQPTVQVVQEPTARPARPTATTERPPPPSPTAAPPRPTRTAVPPTQPPAPPTQPPAPPTVQPTARPIQPTRPPAPPAPAPTQVPAAQPTVRAAQPTARPAQPTPTTRLSQGNGGTGGNGNASTGGNGNGRSRR